MIIRRLAVLGLFAVVGSLIGIAPAQAAVSVSRAELNGTRLRLEGLAIPNRVITVDQVALGTSDGAGNFRIEKDPFAKPADCIVDVDDGSGTPTPARLTGCVVDNPAPPGATGTVSIVRGGSGHGRITSQPAGIDCTITDAGGSGTCNAFFPAGSVVRLDARPAPDSNFLGFRPTPGCIDASKITVAANVIISCQPVFTLRW